MYLHDRLRGSPLALVTLTALLCVAPAAQAEPDATPPAAEPRVEVDDEYRQLVREILVTTDSLQMGIRMADSVVDSMLASLRATQQAVSPEAERIIRETSHELFDKVFGDEDDVVRVQADIYAKHFAKSELRELLAFYKTPIGSKTIEVMPAILNEGMAYSQQRTQDNMAEFQLRLMQRFKEAGVVVP